MPGYLQPLSRTGKHWNYLKKNATAVDKLNQLYLLPRSYLQPQYGRFVNPIFLNEIPEIGVRFKWVLANGKVRSEESLLTF